MIDNHVAEDFGNTAQPVSHNIMLLPNLTPADRFFLAFELIRISKRSNGYHYDYDSAPRPSSRPGEEEFLDAYDPTKYGLKLNDVVDTADNIVFTRGDDNRLKVLLIQRKGHPYKGYWCTPGGFIDAGEDPLTAAVRELQEETGMTLPAESLQFVKTYDYPWRDGRMRNLRANSHVAFIPVIPKFQAADDATDARLVDVGEIFAPNSEWLIGFDHKQLIADSVRHLMD